MPEAPGAHLRPRGTPRLARPVIRRYAPINAGPYAMKYVPPEGFEAAAAYVPIVTRRPITRRTAPATIRFLRAALIVPPVRGGMGYGAVGSTIQGAVRCPGGGFTNWIRGGELADGAGLTACGCTADGVSYAFPRGNVTAPQEPHVAVPSSAYEMLVLPQWPQRVAMPGCQAPCATFPNPHET